MRWCGLAVLLGIVALTSVHAVQEWRPIREACFELGYTDDPAAALVGYFAERGSAVAAESDLLKPILEAGDENLPPWTLVAKLQEGLAKGAAEDRIQLALEARLSALRRARSLADEAARGRGGILLATGQALESGVQEGPLRVLITLAEDHPPGRVMSGIQAAELLHLSGVAPGLGLRIARQCTVREVSDEEMLRVVTKAGEMARAGEGGDAIVDALWR